MNNTASFCGYNSSVLWIKCMNRGCFFASFSLMKILPFTISEDFALQYFLAVDIEIRLVSPLLIILRYEKVMSYIDSCRRLRFFCVPCSL